MIVPVRIKTEFVDIDTAIDANGSQKAAAWELYVELLTRVSTVPLHEEAGFLREALDSLYSLFNTTRAILRSYGPAVARKTSKAEYSVGYLAVTVLNRSLRPFLSRWHPALHDFEERRTAGISKLEYEKQWPENAQCREELEKVREILVQYSDILATICDVPKYGTGRKKSIQ